jgi:hypothetical protein
MFFVLDKEEHKVKKIYSYLGREPMIAILLAAANWEWTTGRCILFLGKRPNVVVRKDLSKCHGLKKYSELWKEELCSENSTIAPLNKIISQWDEFNDAFSLRHTLIHGRGTCSRNMATKPIETMLQATSELYAFARQRGFDLNSRLPIRR